MSWAILKYKLPEESEEFDLAKNGALYSIVIENIYSELRRLEKYENKETLTIQEVRDIITGYMREWNL